MGIRSPCPASRVGWLRSASVLWANAAWCGLSIRAVGTAPREPSRAARRGSSGWVSGPSAEVRVVRIPDHAADPPMPFEERGVDAEQVDDHLRRGRTGAVDHAATPPPRSTTRISRRSGKRFKSVCARVGSVGSRANSHGRRPTREAGRHVVQSRQGARRQSFIERTCSCRHGKRSNALHAGS